ncbi:ComE operon protein 2 [Fundicoccus culcitae]|uniref:ComE operon protein 2 n=1 Tax=Fundicoccus culcitae TaxID=2969821 RepID=A0ABY5P5W6_9LACT|nr:ComE operon protein 2 [Fundicoccus culcitae]UUX34142.1 ComE operon protein 2 [Fundicoccus culcitae]
MVDRIPWNQYFLSQSLVLSLRSTCQRLMVGAVIVREHRMIAGGYNGSVSGEEHCTQVGCYLENGRCVRTVHAEMNAIIQCSKFGASTQGADIYVTHFPCLKCTQAIIQAGIKRIIYLYDYHNHEYALRLIKQAEIEVLKVELSNDIFQQLANFNELNLRKESLD